MALGFNFRWTVPDHQIARSSNIVPGRHLWMAVVWFTVFLSCTPRPAHAQAIQALNNSLNYNLDALMDQIIPLGVTNVRIGVGPAFVPKYQGADSGKITAVPALAFRYGDIVAMDGTQIRVNLLDLHQSTAPPRLSAGPMIKIEFGRSESDSPDLRGLGGVGTSVELGGFVNYNLGPGRLRVAIRQDIADGNRGAVAEFDAGTGIIHTSRLTLAADVGMIWTDRRYMKSFFGVTPIQSVGSGLPIYAPGSGFKSVTLTFGGEYKIIRHWSLGLQTVYERLIGGAAASPLVQVHGSPNQFSLGTFVIYSF
jgi:outer membrane protein